jgi:protein-S-isoprenylcysteine O-methyltransferase Ste14
METLLFLLGFCAAFAGYLLHTALHYAHHRHPYESLSRGMEAVATAVIFIGYAGWGLMLFTDPAPLEIPAAMTVLGGVVGIAGVVLFLLAIYGLHGFRGEQGLVTTGVYGRFRHPMYLGIILMHIGFPVLFGSGFTLLSAGLWVPQVLIWGNWEDEELEEQFGDAYRDYKKKTIL